MSIHEIDGCECTVANHIYGTGNDLSFAQGVVSFLHSIELHPERLSITQVVMRPGLKDCLDSVECQRFHDDLIFRIPVSRIGETRVYEMRVDLPEGITAEQVTEKLHGKPGTRTKVTRMKRACRSQAEISDERIRKIDDSLARIEKSRRKRDAQKRGVVHRIKDMRLELSRLRENLEISTFERVGQLGNEIKRLNALLTDISYREEIAKSTMHNLLAERDLVKP